MRQPLIRAAGCLITGAALLACGSGSAPTGGGAGGAPVTGGAGGGGGGGTGGSRPRDTTFGKGCGLSCAEYGAECGMYVPVDCSLAYDCGGCKGGLVCGGDGTANKCGAPGKWQMVQTPPTVFAGDILAIWGSAADDVWAGDSYGRIAWFDGSEWQLAVNVGSGVPINSIHGTSATNIWFTARTGAVLRLVGNALEPHDFGAGMLRAVWTGGPNDTFVVGQLLSWQWDGRDWRENGPEQLGGTAVWGVPGGPLWLVSDAGWIARRDGTTWKTDLKPGNQGGFIAINGVDASNVWAAGTLLMHWDGQSWSEVSQTGQILGVFTAVWPRTKDDVWAVGTDGLIQHGDGEFFENQPSPTDKTLRAIWGSGPKDIWAGGKDGVLLHYGP